MAQVSSGLQRSAISFRRQGSSGLVWDDRLVSGEIARPKDRSKPRFYSQELALPNRAQQQKQQQQRSRDSRAQDDINVNVKPIKTGRSNNQNDEPASPRVKGCGCCPALGRTPRSGRTVRSIKSRPR
ncbi:uncharacterized protein At1g15400-like [Spinacia oleracea]|uniref:Uncharacterized protein At1g15400-like n=1 Tax=Spinacia oleracea TaxID=3562 RepID=A0A9R0K5F0_SPIOL|nr:uncharacterized protein At1g15400-like [Spinacia oleracea]